MRVHIHVCVYVCVCVCICACTYCYSFYAVYVHFMCEMVTFKKHIRACQSSVTGSTN
jgi:hypothetical protein